jgi:hypothetical protein
MNRLAAALLLLLPAAAALAAAPLDLGMIAGEYSHRLTNGMNDGPSFTSTDILKVVRLSSRRAYVETHLNFFNNHECNFDKIMAVEGNDLVYKGPNDDGDPCEMRLRFARGKITFKDRNNKCRINTCGTRGNYNGTSFSLSSRRPVHDMARLRASDEYRDAMKEAGPK